MYNYDMNQQSIILILSILYIYFLSDLFILINEGPSFRLVFHLGIPIWCKIGYLLIDKLQHFYIVLY